MPNNHAERLSIFQNFVPPTRLIWHSWQYIKKPTGLLIFNVFVPHTQLFGLPGYSAPWSYQTAPNTRQLFNFLERFNELLKKNSGAPKSETVVYHFTKITPATWSINKIIPVSIALGVTFLTFPDSVFSFVSSSSNSMFRVSCQMLLLDICWKIIFLKVSKSWKKICRPQLFQKMNEAHYPKYWKCSG